MEELDMSTPNQPDPDFTAIGEEAARTFRKLFPSPAQVEEQLRATLAHAREVGGGAGALAGGLVEVMEVVHEWNLRTGEDPAAQISIAEAQSAIVEAIERGMGDG
jgi:hypothetical protein